MIHGDRLKKLRIDKNLTQQELGDLLGLKKSTICAYEKGNREPSIEIIIEFMHIFACSADYLIGTDHLIKVKTNKVNKILTMSDEELRFLEELKKNKMIYNIILEDPKRTAELIKNKIG